MRRKIQFLGVIFLLVAPLAAVAQGAFRNLDFESAVLVPVSGDPFAVQFDQAFPGWTGYIGGQVQTTTHVNGIPIGMPGETPFISILAPPWHVSQGSYELAFGAGSLTPVAFAQTGRIPFQARSLQFLASYAPAVFLNGQQQAPVFLGLGPSSSYLIGIDVSRFAGLTMQLRFEPGIPGIQFEYLDAIQFSSQAIPEPSTFAIFGLGALCLGWGRRQVKRS